MILSDGGIIQALADGELRVDPYDDTRLQPASLDVTLAGEFKVQKRHSTPAIYPWDQQVGLWDSVYLPKDRPHATFTLHPGEFALAATRERIGLGRSLAAQVGGKSSLGRIGLIIHATAGFIDPGFSGTVTLEISHVGNIPIALQAGMAIGQLIFFKTDNPVVAPYQGKYKGQTIPTESRYFQNYEPVNTTL